MNEVRRIQRAVGAEPARLVDENTVAGLMVPTDTWVEIDSAVEGNFMERVARGAMTKTLAENGDRIRAIFHHGRDSSIGFKVLGPIKSVTEEDDGYRYAIELLDTSYNADLKPGFRAGLYGTSFNGDVVKRDVVRRPPRSEHNPRGLPEVTYTEIRLREFGPTPLPTYHGTTATMRSLLDDEVIERLAEKGELAYDGEFQPNSRGILVPAGGSVARAVEPEDAPYGISRSRYAHALGFVSETPWAITAQALAVIRAIIAERAAGEKPSLDEIRERIGTVERAQTDAPAGPVAVIGMSGPIVPRADLFSEVSGMTSVEGMQAQLREALGNDDIQAIMLDIDSPGGSVAQIPEFAAELRAAREEKPIIAVANAMSASAAYWLGTQASEFYVTPSGAVGSIGVFTAHDDLSKQLDMEGVSTTLISAGKYKVEGNPFEPLSDEARAYMQSNVDDFYGMFVDDVAKGRGVSSSTVKSDFGQGRMLLARQAAKAGMVDGVLSFDQALARTMKRKSVKRSEPESSGITTRTSEPEPTTATTRSPRKSWEQAGRPDWML